MDHNVIKGEWLVLVCQSCSTDCPSNHSRVSSFNRVCSGTKRISLVRISLLNSVSNDLLPFIVGQSHDSHHELEQTWFETILHKTILSCIYRSLPPFMDGQRHAGYTLLSVKET
jgi:hypothetical protein